MKIPAKLKTAILIVTVVLVLISGVLGFLLLNKEHTRAKILEEKIQLISKEKGTIEKKLKNSQDEITSLNKLLNDSNDKVQSLSKQIESEKSSRQALQGQIEQLNSQLISEKQAKDLLQNKISLLEGDLENFLASFKELEKARVDLESQLKEYEARVNLETIKVDPQDEKTEIAQLSGKVVKIKPEHNFLVIDIGSNQGAKEGDVFSVYHAGEYAGDIKIEKAHPTMSAANFLSNLDVSLVKESDVVVKKD